MKKIKWMFGMLLLTVVLGLAACSSSEDDAESSNGESGDISSDPSNINIAIEQDFISLDPHDVGDTVSIFGTRSMYEGLLGFDENMELEPVLAEDYQVNDESSEFTFQLREDVTFHDGEPFNAEAVKANFDRIMNEDLRAANNVRYVENVEVLGEYEIQFTLSEPYSPMLNKFAMILMASPKAFQDDPDNFPMNPVGTGAFQFEEWNQGSSMVVSKYEDYWGETDSNVEQVTFQPVPENGSRVAMLQTGEADFIYPVPHNNVEELKNNSDLVIEETPSTIARYVSINTQKEPFNDPQVREAMNLAVDQEAFLAVVKDGYGEPLSSTMSSQTQFYQEQELFETDIEKAKDLLADAGYPDGFSAEIWGNTASETSTGMQFVQQQLEQVGIDLEIRSMEEATLSDAIYTPETAEDTDLQMWYVSWSPSSGDADGATRSLFHNEFFPPNGANTAYYDNQQVSEWIDEAVQESDLDAQADIYADIQETIYSEVPWIYLGTDTILSGHTSSLEGVYVLPDGSVSIRNANVN
ncbi:glutathione ABC transporter substrate-binding protein [Gracilibacillus phocaeensis]|uniref:glutathione ABC transporter substrate-binding protein n=1 Tax=Gracilibacillus phocaeensis TaxID=2042304 RepID=UPI00102FF561|nr:glutathione ABC transporter substrate-binding protein [Gracilibacillus phocaeensis]